MRTVSSLACALCFVPCHGGMSELALPLSILGNRHAKAQIEQFLSTVGKVLEYAPLRPCLLWHFLALRLPQESVERAREVAAGIVDALVADSRATLDASTGDFQLSVVCVEQLRQHASVPTAAELLCTLRVLAAAAASGEELNDPILARRVLTPCLETLGHRCYLLATSMGMAPPELVPAQAGEHSASTNLADLWGPDSTALLAPAVPGWSRSLQLLLAPECASASSFVRLLECLARGCRRASSVATELRLREPSRLIARSRLTSCCQRGASCSAAAVLLTSAESARCLLSLGQTPFSDQLSRSCLAWLAEWCPALPALPLECQQPACLEVCASAHRECSAYAHNGIPAVSVDISQAAAGTALLEQARLRLQSVFAHVRIMQGQYSLAVTLLTEAEEAQRALLGLAHPHTLYSNYFLGSALRSAGRAPEALARCEVVASQQQEGKLGEEHIDGALGMAMTLADVGRLQEAMQLARRTFECRSRLLGHDHPDVRSFFFRALVSPRIISDSTCRVC